MHGEEFLAQRDGAILRLARRIQRTTTTGHAVDPVVELIMLFETFLGLIVFVIANLSIFYAAHLIAQRFFPHVPHAARLVGIGVLYYGFIIAALQLLSPAHAITRIWSTALCLTCAMASHLLWGRFANLRADLEPVKEWIRDGFNSPWACLCYMRACRGDQPYPRTADAAPRWVLPHLPPHLSGPVD